MFDVINFQLSFADLIKNKFDLAQFLGVKENKILYKATSETEIDDEDRSVEYIYNDNFFRSDNFTSSHDGLHVLFSGCSESEGVGGNINDAWTNILYNKISKDTKCSGFFNLSRSGWGWSKIVANALIYFERYGYPDVYFILLPNHQRMHKFYNDASNESNLKTPYWRYEQIYPKGYYLPRERDVNLKKFISEEKEYNEQFLNFLVSWKLFNKICIDNNVKLVFSSWDELDCKNLKNFNMFDNFLYMDTINLCGPYIKEWHKTHEKSKYDLKKRDGHHGIILHNFWADSFYSVWKGLSK